MDRAIGCHPHDPRVNKVCLGVIGLGLAQRAHARCAIGVRQRSCSAVAALRMVCFNGHLLCVAFKALILHAGRNEAMRRLFVQVPATWQRLGSATASCVLAKYVRAQLRTDDLSPQPAGVERGYGTICLKLTSGMRLESPEDCTAKAIP